MDRLLWFVFAGSRGGPTRIRIVSTLLDRPLNPHQLARALGLDYKTVEYNLRVLTKHRYVVCPNPETYGADYFPSKNLLAVRAEFEGIAAALRPLPAAGDATQLGKPTNTEPGGTRLP